jgi:hypothetical protein
VKREAGWQCIGGWIFYARKSTEQKIVGNSFRGKKEGDDIESFGYRGGDRGSPHPKEELLPYTWRIIDEVPMAKWRIGGQPVSPEILKAVLSG